VGRVGVQSDRQGTLQCSRGDGRALVLLGGLDLPMLVTPYIHVAKISPLQQALSWFVSSVHDQPSAERAERWSLRQQALTGSVRT
jgi:hypothetical protein